MRLTQILFNENVSTPVYCADDRVLLGEGLFETIRVEEQMPCYSRCHWQRMDKAGAFLGISFELSFERWHAQLIHCIHVATIHTGGIKVILSAGRAPRGLAARGDASSLSFEAFTYTSHQDALTLVSAHWERDANNPIYQVKSVNNLESIIARRQALDRGADDALFFNWENHATETTEANLFIVKQNEVLTPSLASGVLPGIIRARVLGLAQAAGIACIETFIDIDMIFDAEAVFVTNALQGIRMVKSFDDHPFSIDHPLVVSLQDLLLKDSVRGN